MCDCKRLNMADGCKLVLDSDLRLMCESVTIKPTIFMILGLLEKTKVDKEQCETAKGPGGKAKDAILQKERCFIFQSAGLVFQLHL